MFIRVTSNKTLIRLNINQIIAIQPTDTTHAKSTIDMTEGMTIYTNETPEEIDRLIAEARTEPE